MRGDAPRQGQSCGHHGRHLSTTQQNNAPPSTAPTHSLFALIGLPGTQVNDSSPPGSLISFALWLSSPLTLHAGPPLAYLQLSYPFTEKCAIHCEHFPVIMVKVPSLVYINGSHGVPELTWRDLHAAVGGTSKEGKSTQLYLLGETK